MTKTNFSEKQHRSEGLLPTDGKHKNSSSIMAD